MSLTLVKAKGMSGIQKEEPHRVLLNILNYRSLKVCVPAFPKAAASSTQGGNFRFGQDRATELD